MTAVAEDKPVVHQTGVTNDLIAIFEANLRNSEECLGPYLDHAAKTWRTSVEWASNQILGREGDPGFDDGERDRRIFELAREIFVKLMPSFPDVEAQAWKDLERWNPGGTTKPSAGQKGAVGDCGGGGGVVNG